MKTATTKNGNVRGPVVWQTLCGVRGAGTKYLETFKVLGNPRVVAAHQKRYCQFTDRSYTQNAREVSRVCFGLHCHE